MATTSKTTGSRLVEIKNTLVDALGMLNSIWDDIGLQDEQKEKRLDLTFMYIRNLIDEMVTEEEKRRHTLKKNIEVYKEQLSDLCAQLHVSPVQPTASRLYEVESELKKNVQLWETEKERRLTELEQLRTIEQSLCDIMHTTPMYIAKDTVPSNEQLQQLRKHTDQLSTEKNKRYDKFVEQRTQITDIMADIGYDVTTEFEQDVVIEDRECFVLSETNMAQLLVTLEKLQMQRAERVKTVTNLREKITALWNRLDIAKAERDLVMDQVMDHTSTSLQILQDELDRCEVLKFEHLQDFTLKIRKELETWWDKCYYSKQQREAFTPFRCEDYTEEVLIKHEDELEAVKFFYVENEQLLHKIEKRTVLWNQMVEFDRKENDANRFRNRGGNLLAEEREKKKVLHQLPKVEEQLKNEIEEWEQENDRQFLIGGVQFFEFCRLQWDEYKQTKELQKQQRLEQKEKEMQSEIRFGSKPTPAKRRFCAGATPSVTTPKQRKLNDTTRSATRLASLSNIHSVFTSPATPASKRTPMRQSKTTGSLLSLTPASARKPAVPRTPASSMAPPRTPMSSMRPPRTPISTRSTAHKNELHKAKSCASLASPTLKKSMKGLASAKKGPLRGQERPETKLNQENTVPSSSSDDLITLSSQSSEVESAAPSYEEFQNVLHSGKKCKQYRSTICPPK